VRNKFLEELLEKYGQNNSDVWSSITTNQGSIQHLNFLTQEEKDIFKTAFELDQRWLIDLSADRTPYISQAQSLNVFIPADVHKKDLHQIHFQAWKKGLKSLYYCRSKSIQRAEVVSKSFVESSAEKKETNKITNYEECLSCQ
jgi:ribonucleoside-diphosphate reductase alpha chain